MEFDFATNTSVADINKIPQDFRGLYKQDGDKYVLDAENPTIKSAVSAITGLNQALRSARAEAKAKGTTTVDLSPLKDFGATPEEIAAGVKTKLELLQDQIKGVNIPKIKEDLAQEWNGKLTLSESKAKQLESQLHTELVESRATSAIAAEKGNIELLMPVVTKQIKATIVNGKYVVHVVDGSGDIRYSGATGAPMSIKELVTELKSKEQYGVAFASEAAQGGGSQPGAAAGKPANAAQQQQQNRGNMSAFDKIKAGLAKGQHTKNK